MNPVALYRFFKECLPMCRDLFFTYCKKKDYPLFRILFRFNDVLKALHVPRNTRGCLINTIISITKKLHHLVIEFNIEECVCCGRMMHVSCGRRFIEKHCTDVTTIKPCPSFVEELQTCDEHGAGCTIDSPTKIMVKKNRLIVKMISSLLLMNVDMHGGSFVNDDSDCMSAIGILLAIFDHVACYVNDRGKDRWFICPQRSLDKWWRIKLEDREFYTCTHVTMNGIQNMLRGMPGIKKVLEIDDFKFSLSPLLNSPISRRKVIKMLGKSVLYHGMMHASSPDFTGIS